MQLISPDETFGTAEVAVLLKKTQRQVQRLLETGKLAGTRPNGAWVISAFAIWRYQGIEAEMKSHWADVCAKAMRDPENY